MTVTIMPESHVGFVCHCCEWAKQQLTWVRKAYSPHKSNPSKTEVNKSRRIISECSDVKEAFPERHVMQVHRTRALISVTATRP